ncbi:MULTISPECIES: 3-oxosteroid 1-dehydrogenase [Prauserella salsuginis group]|uniref:3-oxosteroid 1-dehydrogenase n=1 Tax=Prauserella salsuginis TaxID=387889 RepID=A0ABW6G8A2_9PSEU|nr:MULTISPECIES: 3-oxosteroid 1-dehydrogenase [Prauserella salsuginis group]MCR3721824.1 3-oxosteroid 1-dehydrogenase [Prauserella flava]MCR3734515.1 3-oxosteroid 1-dehydrogenase [Prauserella salsuginis]
MTGEQAAGAAPREGTDVEEFDVVVVGSGAAGLTAALRAAHLGLSTVVLEKAAAFGGSTARSGGGVWVPGNDALRRAGVSDTPQAAREYLHSIVGDAAEPERIDTYLEHGPAVLSFVERTTPLRLRWVRGYSDYYPEAPGGKAVGRSAEPKPVDARLLGEDRDRLEPPYSAPPLGVPLGQADYRWLSLIARHPRGLLTLLSLGMRWLGGLLLGKRQLVMGQAIAAALRIGVRRAGAEVRLNRPLLRLETAGGRVAGVVVDRDGEEAVVRARHGVVLAAGGFEHNAAMRERYQRAPIGTEWTVGAKANTGDAITAATAVGAAVDLMDDAWWGPSIPLPGGPWFALAERSRPGSIMVNEHGRRFVNESAPYVDAVHAMYGGDQGRGDGPGENIPTWLVFDQRYRNRYMFTGLGPRQPLPGRWYKHGVVVQASSVGELAEKMGVPAAALESTVERFNEYAGAGEDAEFGRGRSRYDHYYGDPRNRPNPSLGALNQAPFYAVKMVPGDLGTKGGVRTDTRARVLREDGSVIDGLYAAGNSSAAVMGRTYAGPGATIGPAMVFGYLAAEDLAETGAGTAAGSGTAAGPEHQDARTDTAS